MLAVFDLSSTLTEMMIVLKKYNGAPYLTAKKKEKQVICTMQ